MTHPYPPLTGLLAGLLSGTEVEGRALAENFCYDERVPEEGRTLYNRRLGDVPPIVSLDEWRQKHFQDFLDLELFVDPSDRSANQPWTFRKENSGNRIHPQVARERWLVRLENAKDAADLAGREGDELMGWIADLRGRDETKQRKAHGWLTKFCADWNEARDLRPVFATYLDEVDDVLQDAAWADLVRDRLGMVHFDPTADGKQGSPLPVLLLQYRVEETIPAGDSAPTLMVPTVLDGELHHGFFPTPRPGQKAPDDERQGGHTVNLSPVAEERNYRYGTELLHPKLDYKPEHLVRCGWIRRKRGLDLDTARKWHLPVVRTYLDREDFRWSDRNP